MGNFKGLKVGEVLSETQFYKVEKIVGDKVQLKNDEGQNIVVNSDYVDNQLSSSTQFTESKAVTRTEMAELVIASARTAMQLSYNKQVKEADVVAELEKEIATAYNNSTPSQFTVAVKKAVKASTKKTLQGEERIMTGRHYGTKDDFGRLHFIDMEQDKDASKTYDTRQRLVDPRTLNWAIVSGVKYTIK